MALSSATSCGCNWTGQTEGKSGDKVAETCGPRLGVGLTECNAAPGQASVGRDDVDDDLFAAKRSH